MQHSKSRNRSSLCFLNLKLHHRFDPFITLYKHTLFRCIHLLGSSMRNFGLISLFQPVLTTTGFVSSGLLWGWMAGDELQHIHYTCRSTITCVTDNSNIFLHYLSKKTIHHQKVQKSSQSRDPKLAFSSETAPYYLPFFEMSLQL